MAGLPLGLLAGWLTAANVVGFNDMLVRLGVVGIAWGLFGVAANQYDLTTAVSVLCLVALVVLLAGTLRTAGATSGPRSRVA